MPIEFEWDPAKAARNAVKHRVSFEIAMRVFADPFALMEQDRFEGSEERWQTIGMVDGRVILLVAHTFRDRPDEGGGEADVIRVTSARKATPGERRRYEQQTGQAQG